MINKCIETVTWFYIPKIVPEVPRLNPGASSQGSSERQFLGNNFKDSF